MRMIHPAGGGGGGGGSGGGAGGGGGGVQFVGTCASIGRSLRALKKKIVATMKPPRQMYRPSPADACATPLDTLFASELMFRKSYPLTATPANDAAIANRKRCTRPSTPA